MNLVDFLSNIFQDVKYSLRLLRKSPAFTLTAVFTLALGIGANAAIFTVILHVLLKPLEYREPERLVRITGGATVARFEAISRAKSLTEVGAFTAFNENINLAGTDGSESLKGARVSVNFLSVLGVCLLSDAAFVKMGRSLDRKQR